MENDFRYKTNRPRAIRRLVIWYRRNAAVTTLVDTAANSASAAGNVAGSVVSSAGSVVSSAGSILQPSGTENLVGYGSVGDDASASRSLRHRMAYNPVPG